MGVVRRRRWLASIATLAFAVAVGILATFWVREAGAWAIVRAPNYGRVIEAPIAPPPDVSRVVRAEVGPPTAVLEAWVIDPPQTPRGTVLVLHGIRDHKTSMLGVGRALAARGLRAVLVDLRGHGASSGRFLTYGVVEARDLSQLVDQLEALGITDGPLGVYGPSYGGAVALQLASIDDRVCAVASLSTFSSLRDVVPPYVSLTLPGVGERLPEGWVDAVVDDAGTLAGFSPDAADTRRAIAHTNAKILLIHGRADHHIPFEHARSLYRACQHDRCALLPVAGDHMGAIGSERAMSAAIEFLAENVRSTGLASIDPRH